MKIGFIGGGSVQWTTKLVADMALNPALQGAELMLHDIDAPALELLGAVCRKLVAETGAHLEIGTTLNRRTCLDGADFVILCVAIGRLEAMRYDLEIPLRYGIRQSVGDTVGPGGLARGLRHIPFALQVAREMEQFCPHAWLLNLTNPMTTICRSVTRSTAVKTIGLCHEVTGVRGRLAEILRVPAETILMKIAGINHLPVILDLKIGGRDGFELLRAWLAENGPQARVDEHVATIRDVFHDRLAVKLTLFRQLGVLFGAGDRHVAEFFPGFLTAASEWGARYGVSLTTIQHREELLAFRRVLLQTYLDGGRLDWSRSDEQLAPLMAALAGGPPGEFIVNVPNHGQVSGLPEGAVVECLARVDGRGVQPYSTDRLPHAAQAVLAGHVARQELIVSAALEDAPEAALAALATDPLVSDPACVEPLLQDLLEANRRFGFD